MTLKLTSGLYKGMPLATPQGDLTRPTGGRVRAAVLNMLLPRIHGAVILDLYAGSGAVGLEMISRGAVGCLFVENGRHALGCLKANVEELKRRAGQQDASVKPLAVMSLDVEGAVKDLRDKALAHPTAPIDLIWMDPPYREVSAVVPRLAPLLADIVPGGGCWVLESSSETEVVAAVESAAGAFWQLEKERAYGRTKITIWERKP